VVLCDRWSFNFFFFNKDLKRICYFTCVATSLMMQGRTGLYDDDDDDDEAGGEDDNNYEDDDNGGGYDDLGDEGLDSDALSQENS